MKASLYISLLLLLVPVFVFGQTIPSGVAITADDIIELLMRIGGFLIIAGGILAGITIVGTGIMYMLAGSNQTKVTAAKAMLKAGIIGALILFSSGMIINTIRGFATSPLNFFGGGGGTSPMYGCNSSGSCVQVIGGPYSISNCNNQCSGGGIPPAYGCNSSRQCVQVIGGPYTTSNCNNQC